MNRFNFAYKALVGIIYFRYRTEYSVWYVTCVIRVSEHITEYTEYLNIIRTLLSLHFLLLCCYNLPANVDTLIKSQFERSEIVICKPSV